MAGKKHIPGTEGVSGMSAFMAQWGKLLCCNAHGLHSYQAPEVWSSNPGPAACQYMQVKQCISS